ncbi:hypothetical protein QVD17_19501 [Tagetes erecta]|uniref:Uncharacterized protein n=1 Tax=Tagetes erecta TaxID=13708 RepID=A0AAD8KR30_TARER|nr:hypothetical protein QVD17_19501 [Tagetes erecta]
MNNQNPNTNAGLKADTSINRKKRKAYLDDRKRKALKKNPLTNISNRLEAPTSSSIHFNGSNGNQQPTDTLFSTSTTSKSRFGSVYVENISNNNVPIVDVEDPVENLIAEVQKGFGISKVLAAKEVTHQ